MRPGVAARHRSADESGTVSLELVLLVPVLVLLTLFVLWAGRGGRAGLTADLAAEEAVTAAALCCDDEGEGDQIEERAIEREAMARDVLESRPGLDFLCIGGIRADNERENSDGIAVSDVFVNDEWVEFGQGEAFTGGIGVLDVRFRCETDGAVAPMAGLLPTVTFEGQAVEVVTRQPKSAGVEISVRETPVFEGEDMEFTVERPDRLEGDIVVTYRIVPPGAPDAEVQTTAERGVDFLLPPEPPADGEDGYDPDEGEGGVGTITMPDGELEATIRIPIRDDCHGGAPVGGGEDCDDDEGRRAHEADVASGARERVVLQLLSAHLATDLDGDDLRDPDRTLAVGEIEESTPLPHVRLECPSDLVLEGHGVSGHSVLRPLTVTLTNLDGSREAPAAHAIHAVVSAIDVTAIRGEDYALPAAGLTVDFAVAEDAGNLSGDVTISDDFDGEGTESFVLTLTEDSSMPWPEYVVWEPTSTRCSVRIQDDEAEVKVSADGPVEEGGQLTFTVTLSRRTAVSALPDSDVVVEYELEPSGRGASAKIEDTCAAIGDAGGPDVTWWLGDNPGSYTSSGTVTFDNPSLPGAVLTQKITVSTCDDLLTEPTEYVWLKVRAAAGSEAVPTAPAWTGARGAILDNDIVQLVVDSPRAPETSGMRPDGTTHGRITFTASLRRGAFTPLLPAGVGAPASPVVVQIRTQGGSGDGLATSGNDCDPNGVSGVDFEADAYFAGDPTSQVTSLIFHGPILDGDGNVIEAAVTEHEVTVTVCDDNLDEVDEVFELVFTQLRDDLRPDLFDGDPMMTDPPALVATGTIVNVGADTLTVDDPTVAENEPLTFTVTLHNPRSNDPVNVSFRLEPRTAKLRGDTARRGDDWTLDDQSMPGDMFTLARDRNALTGTLTLTQHGDVLRGTVRVKTLADKEPENAETIAFVLTSAPDGVTRAKWVGTGTITDVSPAVLNVSSPQIVEGGKLLFEISLVDNDRRPYTDASGRLRIGGNVPVAWFTSDGDGRGAAVGTSSAACPTPGDAENADYVAISRSWYTFTRGGPPTRTVEVQTCNDTEAEGNETLSLEVELDESNPYAASGDPIGTGIIIDQPPPVLRVEDVQAEEGERLEFTVTLGRWQGSGFSRSFVPTPTSETVEFTIGVVPGGSAAPGTDFIVPDPNPLDVELAAGTTSYRYSVATETDSEPEPPETLWVNISRASNADTDKASAEGTINPKCIPFTEDPPAILLSGGPFVEGGTDGILVRLSAPVCGEYAMRSTTTGGTALCGRDLQCSSSTHSHSAAESRPDVRGSVTVPRVYDDDLDEPDETFTFSIGWNTTTGRGDPIPSTWHGLAPVSFEGVIVDNDPKPIIRIADDDAREGTDLKFNLTLNTVSGRDIAFEYRTVGNSATAGMSAADGGDYADGAEAWTRVEIAAGNQPASIVVPTFTDTDTDEGDETLRVELRKVDGGHVTIGDGLAIGIIRESDGPALRIADTDADEGTTMRFVVTLDAAATGQVTVDYATVARPDGYNAATEGTDYTAASGTLTFAAGETRKTIPIQVLSDSDPETDEFFFVELSNAMGASLADPSGVGTINGELTCIDPTHPTADPNSWSSIPASFDESDGRVEVTLQLDHPTCEHFTFIAQGRRSGSGSAIPSVDSPLADFDYRLPGASSGRQMHALTSEVVLPLHIEDDAIDENDEAIYLYVAANCSSPRPPGCPPPVGTLHVGTIVDNDEAGVSVDRTARTTEGRRMSFVVRLGRAVDRALTVDYSTVPIAPDDPRAGATDGVDYRTRSGTVTIPAGDTSATIQITTVEDVLHELTEVFELHISNPSIGTLDTDCDDGRCNVATGRIADDDPKPSVRITNASADEGETLAFVVTLDAPAGTEASVAVATRDGTAREGYDGATAGDDYTAISAGPPVPRLVFAPGEVSKTVSVAALADTDVEKPERFFVDLSDPRSVTLGKWIGTGTIRDVSDRQVSIDDAFVNEGGELEFTLSFPGSPRGKDITIGYTTEADSATAGADYNATFEAGTGTAGTVRILAGQTSAILRIPTVEDSLDEPAERLLVRLANADGATLLKPDAAGTIIDDDPLPSVSVDDTEAIENNERTPARFTVTLSEASGRDVTVPYGTVDGSAKAAAVEGESGTPDYVAAQSNATVTIPAGQTEATVDIALVGDDHEEQTETFQLHLGPTGRPVVNATLDDGIAVARIIDDDGDPVVLIDDPDPVLEADGATVTFTVRLSRPADAAASVDWATEAATAKAAVVTGEPGTPDFTSGSGTLNFAVGEQSKTVAIALVNDDTGEETETFRLKLSAASNLTIGNESATAAILDDDKLPTVSIADARVAEGAAARFVVSLSRASAQAVTVPWSAVADPTAGDRAAVAGQDFAAVTGTLTIPARAAAATVSVATTEDALDEHVERFWVRLGTPTGATLGDGTATGFIVDDDPLPVVSISGASEEEGDPLTFTVRLGAISGREVTVPWATEAVGNAAGHATPGDDYVSASGTLRFPPGTTTRTVEVASVEDTVDEPDEIFEVQLGEPDFATAGVAAATGVITDDDSLPRLSVTDIEVLEDDSPAIFTVTLSRVSSQPVSVDYATRDGTAKAQKVQDERHTPDYGGGRGTLTIAAGLRSGEISVYVVDDEYAESTETFDLVLSNASNAEIAEGAGEATAYILDNEQARISIEGATASEGDGTVDLEVTLSHEVAEEVTVRYATFDGSATQPGDYIAASGTLRFAAGETTATLTLTLTDDIFTEPAETFVVRLSSAAGATLAGDEAIVVILDDDNLPQISVVQPKIVESDGFLVWRVTLSHASDLEVTVDYSSAGWGSSCHGSAETVAGTLSFEPGSTAATISVPVTDDSVACMPIGGGTTIAWPVLDVGLALSNEVNAELAASWVSGEVHDDDGKTVLRIKARGSGGLLASESDGQLLFDLELGRPFAADLTVPIRVNETQALQSEIPPGPGWYDSYASGPQATAVSDFVARNDNVTVPAGEVLVEIAVQIVDDNTAEDTEAFMALIPSRAYDYFVLHNWLERARIVDNDAVSIAVEDIEVVESVGDAVFRLQLDRDNTQTVTVNYATADGTATAPDDYTRTSGIATFAPGTRTVLVNVPIIDDDEADPDETFELRLSTASGATIGTPSATATIRDDGDLPIISIADASTTESEVENVSYLCFTVTVANHPGTPITVDFGPLEAPWLGTLAATPGLDYGVYASGVETHSLPSAESQVCVPVFNDDLPEPDEMFIGWLSNPVDAVLGNQMAWGTIIDRDPPIVSVSDGEVSESGAKVEFTLELHAPDIVQSSADYSTVVHRSAGDAAATPDEDYAHTSGTITFAAGETTATITVPITNDSIDEPDETFLLVLSNPDNIEFGDGVGVGKIKDDDPGWWVDDDVVTEADGGATASVTVHRDHTRASPFTLQYEVSATGGSATGGTSCDTAGVDYVIPSGSLVVPAADTEATISITICDDNVTEGRETLLLELTNVDGRDLAAVVTIADKP